MNESDLIQNEIAAPPRTSRDNSHEKSELQTFDIDVKQVKVNKFNNDLVDIITDNTGNELEKAASVDNLIPVITNQPSEYFT